MGDGRGHLRFAAKVAGERPGVAFAPLVDIVLLLICFYLFVSKSIEDYEDPTIDLPVVAYVQSLEEQPAELVVNLRPDGTVRLNDRPIARSGLGSELMAERARRAGSGKRLIVVIRADRHQSFGALDELLVICREAGIVNVSIRAVER